MSKIFIVEDDLLLLKTFELLLESNGFTTSRAVNGENAVEVFKSALDKPDIILMDHRMPLKNGIDASIEILEIDPNARILFISADRTIKNKAISIGAIDFIEKPFDFNFLLKRINHLLQIAY